MPKSAQTKIEICPDTRKGFYERCRNAEVLITYVIEEYTGSWSLHMFAPGQTANNPSQHLDGRSYLIELNARVQMSPRIDVVGRVHTMIYADKR